MPPVGEPTETIPGRFGDHSTVADSAWEIWDGESRYNWGRESR